MAQFRRTERLNEQLKQEISLLVRDAAMRQDFAALQAAMAADFAHSLDGPEGQLEAISAWRRHRAHDDRLARARLAGQDVESRAQANGEPVDQREVADPQLGKHARR